MGAGPHRPGDDSRQGPVEDGELTAYDLRCDRRGDVDDRAFLICQHADEQSQSSLPCRSQDSARHIAPGADRTPSGHPDAPGNRDGIRWR